MEQANDIEPPLEAVEYLARSPSRVRVLTAISESPRERHELGEVTDVSRVTLSRILANLEGRDWIERTNGRYVATDRGSFVAGEVARLLANMETLEELDGTMAWLPTEAFDFDLSCLRDATVTTSSWSDHTASIRRVGDAIERSRRIVGTASGVSREVVEAVRTATVDAGASFEAVLDATAIDIVRGDADLRGQLRAVAESGNAGLFQYGGAGPLLMVMVCDDAVLLCGHDHDGPPPGTLETTNERVRSWAESYFESVRADARPLGADAFSP